MNKPSFSNNLFFDISRQPYAYSHTYGTVQWVFFLLLAFKDFILKEKKRSALLYGEWLKKKKSNRNCSTKEEKAWKHNFKMKIMNFTGHM